MVVEQRTGDLFAQPDVQALGHGVNLAGRMGAGIATVFRSRWPEMYDEYRQLCRDGELTLGGLYAWLAPDGPWVYNLATQPRPGPHADLAAVESAVREALSHAAAHGVTTIGLPRIGAGIGGLEWRDVLATIESATSGSAVKVIVVSLPASS